MSQALSLTVAVASVTSKRTTVVFVDNMLLECVLYMCHGASCWCFSAAVKVLAPMMAKTLRQMKGMRR